MNHADDSSPRPRARRAYRLPEHGPLPDLPLYERLIEDGLAAADRRYSAVDHITARRLAIWLAARPQDRDFARGLVHFAETGGISPILKTHLRVHVRTPGYPDQLQAAQLLRYCAERGPNVEPISPDFGTTCDQIDRADVMLAALRDRARQGHAAPEQAWPETDGPQILALAGRDPDTGTVSLILDATTANIAMHAIAAHADEREAHVREVERYGQTLPEGSYGRQNRQAIATREARVAARLRAVERAHRLATERDIVFRPPEPAPALRSHRHHVGSEIELE
jgi:hypothetical protein